MSNKLKNEQSPYLLQHANNPVDWYPWGDEAFDRAKAEHKPVIVSIGYAACHWCHVMEHESFENDEVAAYMNTHFVCVKVDREEHPDVDHMYMDAVQAIAGNGGWPLNVFVTPDRAPFYGGTYYPPRPAYSRPSWMQLLERMNEIWTTQQDEVEAQSDQILKHLRQASLKVTSGSAKEPDKAACIQIADTLLKMADKEKGGFGNAPKFPGTMAISYLLEHYHYTGNEPALQQALLSLDSMINGGIYDQLGGGFARYSTDREWLAPHFEKMLYDNALLVVSLCDAYKATGHEKYRKAVTETISFADRELRDNSGGYYCALDADSEGIEGKFYTWTWDEWKAVITEDIGVAEAYFGIREDGNWEGTNILHVAKSVEEVAAEFRMDNEEVKVILLDVKHRLLKERSKRVRPQTDDKCLLSWNALMSIALIKAELAFGGYLQQAVSHMEWMTSEFDGPNGLMHTWKNGVARIPAKLDDYAYLIQALLQLASATGDLQWTSKAVHYLEIVLKEFSSENGYFYFTPYHQKDIPVRKVDNYDGATPSANAIMAHNLWICGMILERTDWIERSEMMITALAETTVRYSYSFGYWAILLQRQLAGMKTIVCSGTDVWQAKEEIQKEWLPHGYLLTLQKEISDLPLLENKFFVGKMYIFVCSGMSCLSPVTSAGEALKLIND